MIDLNITVDDLNQKYNINMTQHLGIIYTEIGKDFVSGKIDKQDFLTVAYFANLYNIPMVIE